MIDSENKYVPQQEVEEPRVESVDVFDATTQPAPVEDGGSAHPTGSSPRLEAFFSRTDDHPLLNSAFRRRR